MGADASAQMVRMLSLRRETHGDRELWVVRKGATPAFPGQRGFVGGSMGDDAVILEGVESEASADSLYSTVQRRRSHLRSHGGEGQEEQRR